MSKRDVLPSPKFNIGDIVLAPLWRCGARRLVIAEVEDLEYRASLKHYTDDGYENGWRYTLKSGRKTWKEKYQSRIRLLVGRREAEADDAGNGLKLRDSDANTKVTSESPQTPSSQARESK